jgi:hypothetical protein
MPVTVNGNTVRVSTAEGAAARADKRAASGGIFENATYTQADAWIEANVTSLATAKTALKQLLKLCYINNIEIRRLKARMDRKDTAHDRSRFVAPQKP